jgi:Ca2+-binding RTX toxin-like protein
MIILEYESWKFGGDGDDSMRGEAGDDALIGSGADDEADGGSGIDTYEAEFEVNYEL